MQFTSLNYEFKWMQNMNEKGHKIGLKWKKISWNVQLYKNLLEIITTHIKWTLKLCFHPYVSKFNVQCSTG